MKRGRVCDRVKTPVGKEKEGKDRSVDIWRSKFGGAAARAVSDRAHGSVMLAVLDELLVRLRVVEELKYHDGAVKVMGVVLGSARMRTSSS